jgi:hypothetical protein
MVQVRSLPEAELHIQSLTIRVQELERMVSDMDQRFDTLQSPLWKRVWFRVQGWPGQRDLNAKGPDHRPWHRWLRP